ncbi:glycosyltransferase [Butyrivibrio sp. VCB2006]|uniref:glycosyltransferase n=1 Tax=Butyrivibrio sp. VCB2006 TaxID=1280679 RepID=UPI00040F1465|nr:glycosyltransferase [Butyrivibrio sp. VCB2006]
MSRLLIINSVLGFGSTGRIVLDIARDYEQKGYEVKVAYGRNMKKQSGGSSDKASEYDRLGVRIGNDMDVYSHVLLSRLSDKHGLYSRAVTKKFLKWASEYDPDILWMHNIHGYYINYEMLFEWIKSRPQMKVKWTLHDCWTFTGHCAYFTYAKCDKWKEGCNDCPQLSSYPAAMKDNSRENYRRKKAAFTSVPNLTIITPSIWLKELVNKSFLSEYPVEVQYNSIDTSVFKPTPSEFKVAHGIQEKKMVLGVASFWEKRKGLDDFIELSQRLDKDKYKVVLVGLNDQQKKELEDNNIDILAVPRTCSPTELAKIYSAADVFVNPTLEDNLPTVNLEAEACGTPVITYDTGGCRETIKSDKSKAIPQNVDSIVESLRNMDM